MTGPLTEAIVGVQRQISLLLGHRLYVDCKEAQYLIQRRAPLRSSVPSQHNTDLDQTGGGEATDLGRGDLREKALRFRLVEQNGD